MRPYLLIFSLCLVSLLQKCSIAQHIPEDFKGKKVYFGSGGGFTGNVITFCLLDNGRLYKKESLKQKEFEFFQKVNNNKSDQLFSNLDVLKIDQIKYNKPGNIYHFIKLNPDDSGIVWDNSNLERPKNAVLIYNLLKSTIKSE